MKKNLLVTIPNLSSPGGVIFFWQALFPHLKDNSEIDLRIVEVGGYGKNVFCAIDDQRNFNKQISSNVDLVILNPSLGFKSFFRDALFAKKLIRKKIPFVVFFHGWDMAFETLVDRWYAGFFLRTFGKASKIIVLCTDFKKKMVQWGFSGEIIIETTTVNKELLRNFNFDQNKKKVGNVNILFLSRLIREKGVYETLEAFRKLKKEYKNIELTIAGDGPEFENLKHQTKADEGIVMTGHIIGEDKTNLFKNTDIYCLPTSYGEGLPVSVLEAMAFGIPVITTRSAGLKDFFQDGKMGYFVGRRDASELEEKLRLLVSNPKEAQKISHFNYQYAAEHVMGDKVAERLYGHIKDLI